MFYQFLNCPTDLRNNWNDLKFGIRVLNASEIILMHNLDLHPILGRL